MAMSGGRCPSRVGDKIASGRKSGARTSATLETSLTPPLLSNFLRQSATKPRFAVVLLAMAERAATDPHLRRNRKRSSKMRIAASGDHQVMCLMVHTARHDANEPEPPELLPILRRHDDRDSRAIIGRHGCECPAVDAAHRRGMRHDHPSDGILHRTYARNGKPHSALNYLLFDFGSKRHIVHVDQMASKRLDVHLRPIGGQVTLQYADDFLDRRECPLTRLHWGHGSRVPGHHGVVLGHIVRVGGLGQHAGRKQ